jgi:hypothetical protein
MRLIDYTDKDMFEISSISRDEKTGRYYILVNDVKSMRSVQKIEMPQELKDLVSADFQDWKKSRKITFKTSYSIGVYGFSTWASIYASIIRKEIKMTTVKAINIIYAIVVAAGIDKNEFFNALFKKYSDAIDRYEKKPTAILFYSKDYGKEISYNVVNIEAELELHKVFQMVIPERFKEYCLAVLEHFGDALLNFKEDPNVRDLQLFYIDYFSDIEIYDDEFYDLSRDKAVKVRFDFSPTPMFNNNCDEGNNWFAKEGTIEDFITVLKNAGATTEDIDKYGEALKLKREIG